MEPLKVLFQKCLSSNCSSIKAKFVNYTANNTNNNKSFSSVVNLKGWWVGFCSTGRQSIIQTHRDKQVKQHRMHTFTYEGNLEQTNNLICSFRLQEEPRVSMQNPHTAQSSAAPVFTLSNTNSYNAFNIFSLLSCVSLKSVAMLPLVCPTVFVTSEANWLHWISLGVLE